MTRPAERDLEELPRADRRSVIDALAALLENPRSVDFHKLAGCPQEWRLHVGRWRVVLRLSNADGIIRVLPVLPRRDAYR